MRPLCRLAFGIGGIYWRVLYSRARCSARVCVCGYGRAVRTSTRTNGQQCSRSMQQDSVPSGRTESEPFSWLAIFALFSVRSLFCSSSRAALRPFSGRSLFAVPSRPAFHYCLASARCPLPLLARSPFELLYLQFQCCSSRQSIPTTHVVARNIHNNRATRNRQHSPKLVRPKPKLTQSIFSLT